MKFEWDMDKATANAAKHGITFDEAATVFYDPSGLLIADPDHSTIEERALLLGYSDRSRLLLVVHVEHDAEFIRIISARRATHTESLHYHRRLG